jgi:chaperone modulatory protein CbpM
MATFDEILHVYRMQRVELNTWIEQRWVRPTQTEQGPIFDEVDEARIALIRELRQDFMVNEDALGLVLSLLDQLYAARRLLKSLEGAIDALPEPVQAQIRLQIREPE